MSIVKFPGKISGFFRIDAGLLPRACTQRYALLRDDDLAARWRA